MSDLRGGLTRVMADTPIRQAHLDLMAGVTRWNGPFARAELGIRPYRDLGLYAFGEWNRTDPMAGIGARWEWDF